MRCFIEFYYGTSFNLFFMAVLVVFSFFRFFFNISVFLLLLCLLLLFVWYFGFDIVVVYLSVCVFSRNSLHLATDIHNLLLCKEGAAGFSLLFNSTGTV